jgi:colanic acid biosynthesis glycosyl transferase WcaI
MASQTAALPFLGKPDVVVSVTPSFPALLPGLMNTRARRVPWLLWVQDILPDGAATTGYLENDGIGYRLSRRLETGSYRNARHIIVLSESFRTNLLAKGVPSEKISLAYNPATIPPGSGSVIRGDIPGPPRILCMGNIGKSQGLDQVVRAFEADPRLAELGAEFALAGAGVAEDEVREAITTDRVKMLGVLGPEELQKEIDRSHLGAVTQTYAGGEFNVPSKLMNYLSAGLPVVASVRPGSEAGRIVQEAGAGWVSDSANLTGFTDSIVEAMADRTRLNECSDAGVEFARRNLTPDALVDRFIPLLPGRPGT